jgi:hypothetical protein
MSRVKSTFPLLALLALAAFGFSACNTLADRRDLYSPTKANGPYTRSLQDGTWADNGVKPVDQEQSVKPDTMPQAAPAPHPAPAATY